MLRALTGCYVVQTFARKRPAVLPGCEVCSLEIKLLR